MISITLAYATPTKQVEIVLQVDEACTIAQAVQQSKMIEQFPEIQLHEMSVGVFGRLATWETKLADGDRVEIYRPLQIDPKVARRMRVKKLRC